MAPYIILGKLTYEALKNIKDIKERDLKGEQIVRAAGGKLLANYYTFGRYDFVTIVDMPSPESLGKVLIEVAKWGTITTETMASILPEQMYKLAKESS